MTRTNASLSSEERARVIEILDLLLARAFAHKDAVAGGREDRARELEAEMHGLFQEKEEIEKWATVGSA